MALKFKRLVCEFQMYYVKLDFEGAEMVLMVQERDEYELTRTQILDRAFLQLKRIPRLQNVSFSPEDVREIEVITKVFAKEKRYKVQSYYVKFDTNTPVDINVNVYHSGVQEKLTRDEIIEEAIGYLEEINITGYTKDNYCEVETLELVEAAPVVEPTPYMLTRILED